MCDVFEKQFARWLALEADFTQHYNLTDAQAERYLSRYSALVICGQHYGIMHTLSCLATL